MRAYMKYTHFATNSIKRTLRHKGSLVGEFILMTVLMTVFYQLWVLVEKQGGLSTFPFTAIEIIFYCAVTETVLNATPKVRVQIEQDIRTGDVAYFLIRPLSYFAMRFSEAWGHIILRMPLFFLLTFFLAWLYTGDLPAGIHNFGLVLLISPLCMMLHLLIHFVIGLSALWIQDTRGFYMIYTKFLFVFSGLFIPLDFYPAWMQDVASWTPFGCILYAPAHLIMQSGSETIWFWLPRILLWTAITALCAWRMLAICHRRMATNGG